MDNARIAVIEDNKAMRDVARRNLEFFGHTVVAEAASLRTALDLVDSMARGDVKADVVLLDGNLTPDTNTYDDARRIAARLKETGVTSLVVGFSTGRLSSNGIEVIADAGKMMNDVLDVIKDL